MQVDDYCLLEVCKAVTIQDLFNLSSTCTRLKQIAERQLSIETKLLIHKKSPITDWSDGAKNQGETNLYRTDPLHSIVLDVSKCTKDFATLLNKLPRLDSITFGVYTTITRGLIEAMNGKLELKSMSFYFPFGLHGKRLSQLKMENLTRLRIRYAGLSEPDLKVVLNKCTKLEFLDLTGNWYISGHSFTTCIAPIRRLEVSRCSGIKYEGMNCMIGKNLESLQIDFLGSVEKIEPEFNLICSSLNDLKSLKFRSSSFGGRDSSSLRWLKNLTSLTIIEVGPMMTDESLIKIIHSCPKITHLHLDICCARGRVSDESIRRIPESLSRLKVLKVKNVKTLTNETFFEFSKMLNLQKILLERCGLISIKVLSVFAQIVNIVIDPCPDVQKVLNDSVETATSNKGKFYSVKVMSTENFKVGSELPKNLKFTFVRKFE